MLADHDSATVELAVTMRRTPQEIDEMLYMDSLLYLQTESRRVRDRASFEAALHGRELR